MGRNSYVSEKSSKTHKKNPTKKHTGRMTSPKIIHESWEFFVYKIIIIRHGYVQQPVAMINQLGCQP